MIQRNLTEYEVRRRRAKAQEPSLSRQCERLWNHLKQGKGINPLESWQQLGIYRLSARILDLRDDGYDIHTDIIEVRSSWGDKARVANYNIGGK